MIQMPLALSDQNYEYMALHMSAASKLALFLQFHPQKNVIAGYLTFEFSSCVC